MTIMPMQQGQSNPEQPFQWGAGGRRMTPEQIAQQQKIAASLMQADYSPVASPWQGLARVAGNITGALQAKSANKAQDANAQRSQSVVQALLAGGTTPDKGALASAAFDPYLDESARGFAGKLLGEMYKPADPPKTYEFDAALAGAGIDPKSPEGMALYRQRAQGLADPFQVMALPGGTYAGPRSGLGAALNGGAPAAGGPQPPATLPPDFDFGEGGQTPPASGSFR